MLDVLWWVLKVAAALTAGVVIYLIGVVVVILNYAGLLPGGVNNLWLIGAIGSIFVGLLLATRYR